jgi:hypothetical protein
VKPSKAKKKSTQEETNEIRAKVKADKKSEREVIRERDILHRESNKNIKEKMELEALRTKQAANTTLKFGNNHIPFLKRVNGSNEHNAKKAIIELNHLFPK